MQTELLHTIYSALVLFGDSQYTGSFAQKAFDQLRSQPVADAIDGLTRVVGEGPSQNGEHIFFRSAPGFLFLQRNESVTGSRSQQELYCRAEINPDYSLHVVAIEAKRGLIDGQLDIGLYVTDESNQIKAQEEFGYSTDNRLTYGVLVQQSASQLKKWLAHDIQHKPQDPFARISDITTLMELVHRQSSLNKLTYSITEAKQPA